MIPKEIPDIYEKIVTLYILRETGVETKTGIVSGFDYPWYLKITDTSSDDNITGGAIYLFLGADSAIKEIQLGKETIYLNDKLPEPYIPFDIGAPNGQRNLNELRKKCFGEGYEYIV